MGGEKKSCGEICTPTCALTKMPEPPWVKYRPQGVVRLEQSFPDLTQEGWPP